MKNAPLMSLAEISDSVQYGYTASASDTEVGPKFLRITDIVPPQIDWNKVPYCEIDEVNLNKFSLVPGDIVIARTGATVGYAKLIRSNEKSVFASYLVRIRVDRDKADPGYVGRIVESDTYKKFVLSHVGGAAQPNANARVLSSFTLPIPQKSVQTHIASVLSAYDDLIENNRRRIQLLEQAARLLYKEWFVHLRFPGHEHVKIRDGVPEGWDMKTLGDLVEVTKGRNITKNSAQYGSVPVVAGGLSPAYYHDTANAVGPVITVSASGANAGYVNLYYEDIWASDCSYISSTSTDRLYYLYLLLKSKQRDIFGFQKGAAQPHVYPKDLKRLSLLAPKDIIVSMFEESVADNFLQVKVLVEQNKLLVQARDLLLPRLMSGNISSSPSQGEKDEKQELYFSR